MTDTYVQGSFAFRCLLAEADLLDEAISALRDIHDDDVPELPSAAILAAFPPTCSDEPWSGLVNAMSDPEFPQICADFSREADAEQPGKAIVGFSSTVDFDPYSIAMLIRGCCRASLTTAPVGFTWAVTCSRPRLDEFSGGWCAVFADRFEIESSNEGLSKALEGEN